MSRETMQHLNTQTLIGMTAERGNAWHHRAEHQGAESNHYEGAVPIEAVQRRLFHWAAEPRRVAVEVPAASLDDMTHLSDAGLPMKWTVQVDRQAITRSDNDHVMGIFKDGYQPHQYNEWLLGTVSNILGDTLVISSAGILKQGALAWVEVSVPETYKIDKHDIAFRPNILSGTSFDGSVATFNKGTKTMTVCDNTFEVARSEKGATYKVKHTRNSGFKLGDARAALNIILEEADDFAAQVSDLAETTVTDRQWFSFLDGFAPLADEKGEKLTGRSLTLAAKKQEELRRLWVRDNRVEPWKNTAFGVLQAVNTWGHHEQTVRGATRSERNMLNAIQGTQAKEDSRALAVLNAVLGA